MGKIYVPITGPMETKRAINKAVAIAKNIGYSLVVINVIDQESIAKLERFKIFVAEESEMLSSGMRRDAEKYLNYAQKMGENIGVAVERVLLEGEPFEQISDYLTHDSEADKLICICKKGDADLVKDTFGSIEKKLFLKTSYDFIVVGESL